MAANCVTATCGCAKKNPWTVGPLGDYEAVWASLQFWTQRPAVGLPEIGRSVYRKKTWWFEVWLSFTIFSANIWNTSVTIISLGSCEISQYMSSKSCSMYPEGIYSDLLSSNSSGSRKTAANRWSVGWLIILNPSNGWNFPTILS